MITLHEAIYALNPQVTYIRDKDAFDNEGNPVEYDLEAAEVKLEQMQAEEELAAQKQLEARQSALNKLMALGLTEEEALALGVK